MFGLPDLPEPLHFLQEKCFEDDYLPPQRLKLAGLPYDEDSRSIHDVCLDIFSTPDPLTDQFSKLSFNDVYGDGDSDGEPERGASSRGPGSEAITSYLDAAKAAKDEDVLGSEPKATSGDINTNDVRNPETYLEPKFVDTSRKSGITYQDAPQAPSFATTHRLKEHLYRTHRQKPNCPRCRSIFSTDDEVAGHLLSEASCERSLHLTVEGFDALQKEKLQSKRRGWAKSEVEKWVDIYRILFPDCNDIPDPYYHPNFNGATPGPPTARNEHALDIESFSPRELPPELEEEAFRKLGEVIGSQQWDRRKRRKVVHVFRTAFQTYAAKVLQQPQDTTSGKASVERSETEKESDEPQIESNTTLGSTHSPPEAKTSSSTAALGESHMQRSRSVSHETFIDTHAAKDNGSPPVQISDFNFGDDLNLQCWPEWNQGYVAEEGYDWTTVSAFELPTPRWNHTFDYAVTQGDGNSIVHNDFEFYRAPRYFTAEWAHWQELVKPNAEDKDKDDSEEYDSDDGWYSPVADKPRSRHYVWYSGWKLQATTMVKASHYYRAHTLSAEKARCYYSIDNTINQMSRNIARGLRPRLQLPVWTWGTSDHRGFWSTISRHGRDAKDAFVNLDSDFICIHERCWPEPQEMVDKRRRRWMGSICNLLIDTEINVHTGSEDEARREIIKGFTEENLWLWKMRRYLPNLKVIRRALTDKAPQLLNEWAYFQTRYLLREAHDEQWRSIRHDIATETHWLPAMCSPNEPQWRPFLDRLLDSDATVRGAIPQDLTLEDDEVLGSRKLFGGYFQALVDADAEER